MAKKYGSKQYTSPYIFASFCGSTTMFFVLLVSVLLVSRMLPYGKEESEYSEVLCYTMHIENKLFNFFLNLWSFKDSNRPILLK